MSLYMPLVAEKTNLPATTLAEDIFRQEPPPAAPVVAAPKGKVAAKSVAVGARSKAKSTPGGVLKTNNGEIHDALENRPPNKEHISRT